MKGLRATALAAVCAALVVVSWTESDPRAVGFEVWHSTDLVNWNLYLKTSNCFCAGGTNAAEFFRVRAYDACGHTSDWGHTGP